MVATRLLFAGLLTTLAISAAACVAAPERGMVGIAPVDESAGISADGAWGQGPTLIWGETISAKDSAPLIPQAVLASGRLQSVDLRCRVGAEGHLEACVVDRESLLGVGMGPAAVQVAERCRVNDKLSDGTSTLGLYLPVTMYFDVGGRPARPRIIPKLNGFSRKPLAPVAHPLDAPPPATSGG